jgi:hypothetical protein
VLGALSQSQRLVTGGLIGAAFLVGVDLFIVNVAFDQIGHDFDGRPRRQGRQESAFKRESVTRIFPNYSFRTGHGASCAGKAARDATDICAGHSNDALKFAMHT